LPTQASHRSGRAHIRASGSSDGGFARQPKAVSPICYPGRDGDTWFRVQSLGRSARPRSQHQAPPFGFSFPPPGPAGPVPRLHRYYEGAATSYRPSRRASLPWLGGTSAPLVAFAPRRTSAPPRPGVGHPVAPAGNLPRKREGSPKFLGNLDCPFARVLATPAGLLTPDQYSAAAWPLDPEVQRLPQLVFRRSITWLSDSLSTLRRVRYLTTTQDSLPVAGQALPGGLSTHKISLRGFRIDPQTTRIFSGCRPSDDAVIIGISALCKLADWLEVQALVADQGGRKCLPTLPEESPPAPAANLGPNAIGATVARGTVGGDPPLRTADTQPRHTTTICYARHTGSGVNFTSGDTDAKQNDTNEDNTEHGDTNNHVTSNRRGGDA